MCVNDDCRIILSFFRWADDPWNTRKIGVEVFDTLLYNNCLSERDTNLYKNFIGVEVAF